MTNAGVVQPSEHGDSLSEVAGENPASRSIVVERAISLTQPWATLMACGAKRIETRSWPTRTRGWLGIHAAKNFPLDCRTYCFLEPFASALVAAGVQDLADLPRGKLIAVVDLAYCRHTEDLRAGILSPERDFGDYSDDRYAFVTEKVRRLREPIPMNGALGIWRMPRIITEGDLLNEPA